MLDYPDSRCITEGRCSKNFPKPFRSKTFSIESDNCVSYRRRSPEEVGEFEVRTKKSNALGIHKMGIDNSWIVPYSPDLLRKLRTHMNVELCISIVGSIKYLFKYVRKGSDQQQLRPTDGQNESIGKGVPPLMKHGTTKMRDMFRLLKRHGGFFFPMVGHETSVERLEVHLKGHHTVFCKEGEHENARTLGREKSTKLIASFAANHKFKNAKSILYVEYPKYLTWEKAKMIWRPRAKSNVRSKSSENYEFSTCSTSVIGSMYDICPREVERYFLQTLLLRKSGATYFADMRLHEGVQHPNYRDICCSMGLLSDDAEWLRCMEDTSYSDFDRLAEFFFYNNGFL